MFVGGVICLLLGLTMWVGMVANVTKNMRSRNWATVVGEVTRSDYEEYDETDSDGFTSKSWRAHLMYRYVVNGNVHHGTQVGIAQSLPVNKRSCQEQATRFPVGSNPVVYYDPDKPKHSCLDRKVSAGSMVGIVFVILLGLLLTAIGVSLLIPSRSDGS